MFATRSNRKCHMQSISAPQEIIIFFFHISPSAIGMHFEQDGYKPCQNPRLPTGSDPGRTNWEPPMGSRSSNLATPFGLDRLGEYHGILNDC